MSEGSRCWRRDSAGVRTPSGSRALPSRRRSPLVGEATELAVRAFGAGHWAANPELTLRYYSKSRGFWMYAGSSVREKDGTRWSFTPFAVVWASPDRKKLKTLTSRKAVVDFDQPAGLTKPGAKSGKVISARVEEDVRVRDDKGTVNPDDDLVIGPLTYLEYVEKGRRTDGAIGPQIRSDSETVIREPGLVALSPLGFRLNLRAADPVAEKPPAADDDGMAGFNGVETARLVGDVRVILDDVGAEGILPGGGSAEPDSASKSAADSKKTIKQKTPLVVTSDGPIDRPLSRTPSSFEMGSGRDSRSDPSRVRPQRPRRAQRAQARPPALRRSLAHNDGRRQEDSGFEDSRFQRYGFQESRNRQQLERRSAQKGIGTGGGERRRIVEIVAEKGEGGWTRGVAGLAAQGFTVRCNELIHEKFEDGRPDKTILLANAGRRLKLEKKDIDDKGTLNSITDIETVAATIYRRPRQNSTPLGHRHRAWNACNATRSRQTGLANRRMAQSIGVENRGRRQKSAQVIVLTAHGFGSAGKVRPQIA